MKARRRWAEFEGYRALAALAVVAFHIRQNMQVHVFEPGQGLHPGSAYPYDHVHWFESVIANVDIVVDFFFVLSGFLLVLPFARAVLAGTALPSIRTFAFGRLLRIVPLYWAIVLVVWSTRNFGYPGEWRDLVEHLTFTQVFDSKRIFYTLGPAWTLADEMWFYVTVPFVALGAAALVARTRWLGGTTRTRGLVAYVSILGVLIAGSVGWKLLAMHVWNVPRDHWAFYFGVPARLDTFCIGSVAAVLVAWADGRQLPRGAALTLRVGSLVTLWWFVSHRVSDMGWWNDFVHTGCATFFALIVIAVTSSRPGIAHRLCDNKVVIGAGGLTFALYIGHEALLDPLSSAGLLRMPFHDMLWNWAIGIPIACLAAWIVHVLIEEPATRLRLAFDRNWHSREYYPDLVDPMAPELIPPAEPLAGPVAEVAPVGAVSGTPTVAEPARPRPSPHRGPLAVSSAETGARGVPGPRSPRARPRPTPAAGAGTRPSPRPTGRTRQKVNS